MQRTKWISLLAGLVALVVLLLLGRRLAGYIPAFAGWVESLGALGPIAFMAGYVLATVALVPGSLLTLAGGALFGVVRGTAFVFVAATLGAIAAFLIARYAARAAVVRRLGGQPRFRALDAAVAREGRRIVFLIRLSPLFPFNLTNYAVGLTSIPLRDYAIACLGMLPGTLLWVYYGRLIGDVAALVAGAPTPRGTAYWSLLGIGLLATVAVTALITRAAKRALASSLRDDDGENA